MTPPDGPRFTPVVRGFPAFAIAVFLDRRGLLESLSADVHPSYRAELEATLADLRLAADQWRDFKASTAVSGSTALPSEPTRAGSWMTTDEAAEVLGVTPNRVRQLVRDGVLPSQKKGGRHMVDAAAVELRAAA